jgi:hypothetical protein
MEKINWPSWFKQAENIRKKADRAIIMNEKGS